MQAPDDDDDDVTPLVLFDVERLSGSACISCGAILCGHAALLAVVLGFKNAPRCAACFARALETPEAVLVADAYAHISRRSCFGRALLAVSAREGFEAGPVCVFAPRASPNDALGGIAPVCDPMENVESAQVWDAGDMSCGDLVLELRTRLGALKPAAILEVRATDRGAPLDIPAWCGLTGNRLLSAAYPLFRIQRKR